MNYSNFISFTKKDSPPKKLTSIELAMWHVINHNWDNAHNIVQGINNEIGFWIHAHIHRIEGDISNANYWYSKANRDQLQLTLKEEPEQIIRFITTK